MINKENNKFLFEDILREFIELNNYSKTKNIIDKDKVVDKVLQPLTVLRCTEDNYTIYFLHNGYSIVIPWDWIDFFNSLNQFAGDRILGAKKEVFEFNERISNFIYEFILFITSLDAQRYSIALDSISNLCIEKSEELSNWLSKNYEIDLGTIEFRSPKKICNI